MAITTCVFDAYGTLFDVASAAREAAGRPENAEIAENWAKLAGIGVKNSCNTVGCGLLWALTLIFGR